MLKIVGLVEKTPQNFVKDPFIQIIPHLEFPGRLSCDANIIVDLDGNKQNSGAIGYNNVPVEGDIKLAYDSLINEIEKYIANDLASKNKDILISSVNSNYQDPNAIVEIPVEN